MHEFGKPDPSRETEETDRALITDENYVLPATQEAPVIGATDHPTQTSEIPAYVPELPSPSETQEFESLGSQVADAIQSWSSSISLPDKLEFVNGVVSELVPTLDFTQEIINNRLTACAVISGLYHNELSGEPPFEADLIRGIQFAQKLRGGDYRMSKLFDAVVEYMQNRFRDPSRNSLTISAFHTEIQQEIRANTLSKENAVYLFVVSLI